MSRPSVIGNQPEIRALPDTVKQLLLTELGRIKEWG